MPDDSLMTLWDFRSWMLHIYWEIRLSDRKKDKVAKDFIVNWFAAVDKEFSKLSKIEQKLDRKG